MDWASVPPMLTVFATIAIAFAGGVWALIKWGFGGVTDRFDDQKYRMDGIVELVNVRFDDQNYRMDGIVDLVNVRFDAADQRINEQNGRMDVRFDAVDQRFEE